MKRALCLTTAVLIALVVSTPTLRADNGDYRGYPVDSTVKIWIHWHSFEAQGIPAHWQGPFTDCVINAYTRWIHVAGMRLKPKFWGYTTETAPRADEILIMMNARHHPSDDRIASRFGSPALIVFHRRSAVSNTPWNFVPRRARASGEIDMQAVLMHELGHAFGLEHEADLNTVMFGGYQWTNRYGPFPDDIEDLRAQYGPQTDWRFKIKRSVNGGASWADWGTNLTALNLATTMDPAVARDPARTILFYTHTNKHPAWIIGNTTGAAFDPGQWWVFGGSRSAYGTAGHGDNQTYLMAWVDDLAQHHIQVAYSNDGGVHWGFVTPPPAARSYGTPAVHKLAAHTWLLAYTKYDPSSLADTGKIVTRVSTDDGASWGPEIVLNAFYRAESGVSITSSGLANIRIGFSWAHSDVSATYSYPNYLKRTIRAHWDGTTLVYDTMIYEADSTRTHPVMAKTSSRFVQAWREPNALTSINTRNAAPGETTWNNYVRVVESSPATPALAAYRKKTFAFLYYLME